VNKVSYKQLVAIIYTIVLFLDRLDLTIVNVALPTIAKQFNVPIVTTDWISLAFLLSLAVSIPISGWLGEYFGFKKIYATAIVLFGLGSTLCAIAPDLNTLIALRFLQGIGGGLLIPVGMTMIYRIYDKSEYASITSFTFIPSLIAPAIAPFLGGILLVSFGWQSVFLFSGPICLVLSIIVITLLKEEDHRSKTPLDWLGFILSSVILIDLFYTLSVLSRDGFSIISMISLIILIPLIFIFIYVERSNKYPLINLTYFENITFIKANLIQLCFQICHFGAIFLIGMYLQIGIGYSAMLAGLMMGMQAVGAMTTSRLSVRLFNNYGPYSPIIIGLLGIAIVSPLILLINTTNMLAFGLTIFFIRGLFSGLCGTPIQTLSIIDFHKESMSTINGVFNACRQVSISLGVAVTSMLISVGLKLSKLNGTYEMNSEQAYQVFKYGFFAISVIAIIGILICKYPSANKSAMDIKPTDLAPKNRVV